MPEPALDVIRGKNATVSEELFSEPVHLCLSTFLAEINLAKDVIAGAAELGRGWGSISETPEFTNDETQGLSEIVGVEAGGDDEIAGVFEKTRCGINGIGKAAVFTDDLEKA